MKNKTLIIALALSTGILMSCREEKKAEEPAETEVTTPVVEDTIDKDEKRRLDSIRQVKEHGHAH